MCKLYPYPIGGGNSTLTVTNLPVGSYDLYLYGHGGPGVDTQNSVFEVVSGTNNYGTKATTTTSGWTSAVWQEGQQYVVFQDVGVANAAEVLEVRVLPGASGYAIISGMQLVQKSTTPPPTADFTASPTSGEVPLTVQFTDKSSSGLAAWDWDFGDGSTHGTDQNPTHTFTNIGRFTVTLTVTGSSGGTGHKSQTIQVTAPPPPPVAGSVLDVDFGVGTSSAKVGFAATGQTSNDYWNLYSRDDGSGGYRTFGQVSNLKWADGAASAAGLTVANAPGAWNNGTEDPMFTVYLYPL